jgi:hypothetical protein
MIKTDEYLTISQQEKKKGLGKGQDPVVLE